MSISFFGDFGDHRTGVSQELGQQRSSLAALQASSAAAPTDQHIRNLFDGLVSDKIDVIVAQRLDDHWVDLNMLFE